MAINKNHEFEELDGIKCAIVEKNVSPVRTAFLKELLTFNKFSVVVLPSPAPKASPAPLANALNDTPIDPQPGPPETFTVGVTNVMFNTINAVFGRLLRTPDGHTVTLAYWNQKEVVAKDEIPYFENII